MPGPTERTGLWSEAVTVRRIVIDPVDVLLDLAAAEHALWSWWAGHVGLPVDEVADLARTGPLPETARTLRDRAAGPDGQRRDADGAEDVARLRARRAELHRLARRRRGAASLLRSIPAGRAAVWTTLDEDELATLERRARLPLPPARLCGLRVDDAARAAAFLDGLGDAPDRWLALESYPATAARSERIGCRVLIVRPEAGRAVPAGPPHGPTDGRAGAARGRPSVEDPALLSVTPAAEGLTVGIRRQPRLLPDR